MIFAFIFAGFSGGLLFHALNAQLTATHVSFNREFPLKTPVVHGLRVFCALSNSNKLTALTSLNSNENHKRAVWF